MTPQRDHVASLSVGQGLFKAMLCEQGVRKDVGIADLFPVGGRADLHEVSDHVNLRRTVQKRVTQGLAPFANGYYRKQILGRSSYVPQGPRPTKTHPKYDTLSLSESKRLPDEFRAGREISTDVSGITLAGSPDPRACPCPLESEAQTAPPPSPDRTVTPLTSPLSGRTAAETSTPSAAGPSPNCRREM